MELVEATRIVLGIGKGDESVENSLEKTWEGKENGGNIFFSSMIPKIRE